MKHILRAALVVVLALAFAGPASANKLDPRTPKTNVTIDRTSVINPPPSVRQPGPRTRLITLLSMAGASVVGAIIFHNKRVRVDDAKMTRGHRAAAAS